MAETALMTTLLVHGTLVLLGTSLCTAYKKQVPKHDSMSYEDVLGKYVLDAYKSRSKYGRPVLHYNDTLTVEFAIQLTQIVDLDEQEQVLTLNVWDQYMWQDHHIYWDPEEYGNVTSIRITSDKIWTPDIKLYNYADMRLEEHRKPLCVVYNDGKIFWMPQAIYRSSCNIDVYAFPFDVQNCSLKFGSWTYDGFKLNVKFYLEKNFIDLTEYVESNAWTIIDVPAERNVKRYTCCPAPFIDLKYYLVFQRRATLYNYILILPCILLTSITLILFWIPPESPAKMQLGLTIFIAFFILLKLLEKNLPPGTAHMPLLGTYYCLNMIIITMSCFLNVLIVDLTAHGTRASKPPSCIWLYYDVLAKFLRMTDLVRPLKAAIERSKMPDKRYDESDKWTHHGDAAASNEALAQLQQEQVIRCGGPMAEIESKLVELRAFIRDQRQRMDEKDRKELLSKHWKAVALISDRIFFIVYLLIIVGSLGYTLPVLTSSGKGLESRLLEKARTRMD
ncbi:neuronal acetylcholine receptor subunit alpha-5-like [Babylonia areolata]|uniref:neuronal acetylcholine receptor subunit alpha-5-like n=1 Tax=Babylonia areolata TaxID=304850 RepID=UPI003FD1254C